jgi:hypothetical protein
VELAERVERLERANRRLSLAAGLAVALAVGWGRLGAEGGPGPVAATRFALIDEKGQDRAVLETVENGGPQLLLSDAEGNVDLAHFAVLAGVRSLALHEEESLRAALAAQPDGSTTLDDTGRVYLPGGCRSKTQCVAV